MLEHALISTDPVQGCDRLSHAGRHAIGVASNLLHLRPRII